MNSSIVPLTELSLVSCFCLRHSDLLASLYLLTKKPDTHRVNERLWYTPCVNVLIVKALQNARCIVLLLIVFLVVICHAALQHTCSLQLHKHVSPAHAFTCRLHIVLFWPLLTVHAKHMYCCCNHFRLAEQLLSSIMTWSLIYPRVVCDSQLPVFQLAGTRCLWYHQQCPCPMCLC